MVIRFLVPFMSETTLAARPFSVTSLPLPPNGTGSPLVQEGTTRASSYCRVNLLSSYFLSCFPPSPRSGFPCRGRSCSGRASRDCGPASRCCCCERSGLTSLDCGCNSLGCTSRNFGPASRCCGCVRSGVTSLNCGRNCLGCTSRVGCGDRLRGCKPWTPQVCSFSHRLLFSQPLQFC